MGATKRQGTIHGHMFVGVFEISKYNLVKYQGWLSLIVCLPVSLKLERPRWSLHGTLSPWITRGYLDQVGIDLYLQGYVVREFLFSLKNMTSFQLSDAGFPLGRRLVPVAYTTLLYWSDILAANLGLKHHVGGQSVLHGQC